MRFTARATIYKCRNLNTDIATYDTQTAVRLLLCTVLHPCACYLAVIQIKSQ